ncbi:hypothetical protein PIB30_079027 [Stylosanthes scabra]|uniref:Uncharacterized protein n=1 Tax=Stylosanthes scabra TaxID=79078 RepID=A0ABU6UPV0_9FABA|nr:hypothetical protein [Stylosanthes scabra]
MRVKQEMGVSMLFGGDCNEIVVEQERKGYTWYGGWSCSRIDRVLINKRFGLIDQKINEVEQEIGLVDAKVELGEVNDCLLGQQRALRVLVEK